MSLQDEVEIECPYYGERLVLLVDGSTGAQEYVEDCQVCCRPMNNIVTVNEDDYPQVEVRREDEYRAGLCSDPENSIGCACTVHGRRNAASARTTPSSFILLYG